MHSFYRTVLTKRELSWNAKLSIYRAIFVPNLTYFHEEWVMNKRTSSQAEKMGFIKRVTGVSLRDGVRRSVICEELVVEPLLLRVERSQLRWFAHLVGMPPWHAPREVIQARTFRKRTLGRPRTIWRDYVSTLAWECLGIPQSESKDVARERDVWDPLLELLLPRTDPRISG